MKVFIVSRVRRWWNFRFTTILDVFSLESSALFSYPGTTWCGEGRRSKQEGWWTFIIIETHELKINANPRT